MDHIRKEQDKSMTPLSTNFHTSMITYCPSQRHLLDSRSDEGSSSCQNVNNNNVYKGCNLINLSTYYFVKQSEWLLGTFLFKR